MPRPAVLLLLASSAVLGGAGPCVTSTEPTNEPPVETVVRPTQSRGTVSGRVMDFLAGAPAADVKVTLLVGGTVFPTQQTAADGTFSFSEVPAGGESSVLMEKAGFEPLLQGVTIPAAAGNFPTETAVAFVGPVHLLSTGSSFSVRVLLPDGSPAQGFTALARLPAAWVALTAAGVPQARGLLLRSTTSITDGVASFGALPDLAALAQRLPDLQLTVTISAPVVNNLPVAAGLEKTWRLGDLLALGTLASQTVVLSGYDPGEELKIVASNVPDLVDGRTVQLPGTVEPGGGMTAPGLVGVLFNQPVTAESVDVVLVDERGRAIPSGPTSLTRPTVLQLQDGGSAPLSSLDIQLPILEPGAENNLLITAKPVANRGRRVWGRPLYSAQVARAIQVGAVRRITQRAPDMDGSVDERLFAGDRFYVDLKGTVGGRKADGTPVPAADFRPVVLQVVGTYFDAVGGINALASFITSCELAEPAVPPPYTLGGFTTRLACTAPALALVPANAPLPPLTPSFTQVTVTFNDSAARDNRPTPGTVTVTTPDGAVALTATNTAALPLLND